MSSYWDGDNASVFIPSSQWKSIYDFFAIVKPTFFEDYIIELSDDETFKDCYNGAKSKIFSFVVLICLAFIIL